MDKLKFLDTIFKIYIDNYIFLNLNLFKYFVIPPHSE